MILKFFKICLYLTSFLFLTGFVQIPAVMGPAITIATSGNLAKATAQLVFDYEFKKKTGKSSLNYISEEVSKKKVPEETLRLLHIQKDLSVKQLIQYPELYYAKSHYPLELSQRAFDHLWRMCESYELWCKETNQKKLIVLNLTD